MTKSDQKMTGAEFRDCLDRYGEDVSAWPRAEAAHDLLMESEEARSSLDEMKRLRALFSFASRSGIKAPGGLAARIAAAVLAESSRSPANADAGMPSSVPAGSKAAGGAARTSPGVSRKQVRFA